MDIIEKIQATIGHLEEISNQDNPNLEKIKEQVDLIKNEILPKLDEDFNKWINRIDNPCEPDEKVEIIIDQVNDLFIQANELIDTIRKQYDIKIASDADFLDVQDDCELCRSILNDEKDDYDEGNHDEYDIVLHEISKNALVAIGLNNNDEQSVNLMGTILIGIASGESDDDIAGRAFAQILLSGFVLSIDKIKEMCKETRNKCKKQLIGLQIAFSSLQDYHCSAEEALYQIQLFL